VFAPRSGKSSSSSPFTMQPMVAADALESNLFRLAHPDTVGLNTPKKPQGIFTRDRGHFLKKRG
jgi:hypothetical protein